MLRVQVVSRSDCFAQDGAMLRTTDHTGLENRNTDQIRQYLIALLLDHVVPRAAFHCMARSLSGTAKHGQNRHKQHVKRIGQIALLWGLTDFWLLYTKSLPEPTLKVDASMFFKVHVQAIFEPDAACEFGGCKGICKRTMTSCVSTCALWSCRATNLKLGIHSVCSSSIMACIHTDISYRSSGTEILIKSPFLYVSVSHSPNNMLALCTFFERSIRDGVCTRGSGCVCSFVLTPFFSLSICLVLRLGTLPLQKDAGRSDWESVRDLDLFCHLKCLLSFSRFSASLTDDDSCGHIAWLSHSKTSNWKLQTGSPLSSTLEHSTE